MEVFGKHWVGQKEGGREDRKEEEGKGGRRRRKGRKVSLSLFPSSPLTFLAKSKASQPGDTARWGEASEEVGRGRRGRRQLLTKQHLLAEAYKRFVHCC